MLREQTAVLFVNCCVTAGGSKRKARTVLRFGKCVGKSCIPLHPVLTSRKCCCYYVQCFSSVKLFLMGVWIYYVSGRVNRNISTAVSVNGQGTHMPNGCKAVQPIHSEGITVVSKCRPTTLIQWLHQWSSSKYIT